jgi:lysozyme
MKRNIIIRKAATVVAAIFVSCWASQVQANNTPRNLFGIDVSSAQGSINWSNVYSAGARFAYAKATEGTSVTDADFAGNMKRGKRNSLQMGAYHFAYPAQTCPSAQANYFWSVAGGNIVADGQSISPAVDLEEFTGIACGEGSYTAWLNDYYNDLRTKTAVVFQAVLAISPCNSCFLSGPTLGPWILNENGQNLYTGNPWRFAARAIRGTRQANVTAMRGSFGSPHREALTASVAVAISMPTTAR